MTEIQFFVGPLMEKNNQNLTTKKILLAEAVALLLLLSGSLIDDFDYGTWIVIWIFWVLVMNIARVGYLATTPPRLHWGWLVLLLAMPLLPFVIGLAAIFTSNARMC